ncbi:hypothetical protein FKP32DRAFT_1577085, partial [Trametes sanguinea]
MRTTRNARLIRWDEFISKFKAEFEHIPGTENKVADCLSRYYENDHVGETHPVQKYVNADIRLEREVSELTRLRQEELREIERMFALRERSEPRDEEAALLATSTNASTGSPAAPQSRVTVQDALRDGPPLDKVMTTTPGMLAAIKQHYTDDATFGKVLSNISAFPTFSLKDGLLFMDSRLGARCLCIPWGTLGKRRLTEIIVDEAHRTLGHLGALKTAEYIRRWYWW